MGLGQDKSSSWKSFFYFSKKKITDRPNDHHHHTILCSTQILRKENNERWCNLVWVSTVVVVEVGASVFIIYCQKIWAIFLIITSLGHGKGKVLRREGELELLLLISEVYIVVYKPGLPSFVLMWAVLDSEFFFIFNAY